MAQRHTGCGFTWRAGVRPIGVDPIGPAADGSIDVAADVEMETELVEAESELADLLCGCRFAVTQ